MMERMDFRIGEPAGPGKEVLLTLEKHFLFILKRCDQLEAKQGRAIHEMRRSFKKSRALLRLVRDSMGYASYFLENRCLRDMQRLLSPARDGDVILVLLNRLRKDFPALNEKPWYAGVVEGAGGRRDAAWEALLQARIPDLIRRGMGQAVDRLAHYRFSGEGFDQLEGGISRIYRQGQDMLGEAYREDAVSSTIHQFRKRAKYRQNQTAFLEALSPEILGPEFRSLQKLSDILGDYNDYSNALVLLPMLAPVDAETRHELESLEVDLQRRMARLKKRAAKISSGLYAEDPEQYLTRMRSYWETTLQI